MQDESHPPYLGRGIVLSLVAYVFFITASSFVRNFDGKIPTIQIVFFQNFIALLFTLPLSLRHGIRSLKTSAGLTHLIRDASGVASYFFYFLCIGYLGLADATTLNYTAPFFVPLIWRVWKKQKVGRSVWWAIGIGFVGVALILRPSMGLLQAGFILGVLAGVFSGIGFAGLRVLNLMKEPMSRTLFYYFLFGTMISLPFVWTGWVEMNGSEWGQVVGVGLATAIGQVLLTISYRYGTASFLSPLGYSSVVYAGIIGWFFFNHSLTIHSLFGTLLIIAGGSATYALKKKPKSFVETFRTPKPHEKPPL